MKLTRRLEDGARAVARATRSLGSDLAADGPEAAYLRVLDGEHLWVAVDAAAGRPALWDPEGGELVDATELPAGADPAYASARWRLDDVLPRVEGAELQLVVLDESRRPAPLRPGPPAPESNLRVPPTPDGRWRFQVAADEAGFVRVRRTAAARVARLLDIALAADGVRLTCAPPEPVEPRLLFLRKDDVVAGAVDMERSGDDLVATIDAGDVPPDAGGYRVAVGSDADPLTVVRLRNDLQVPDGMAVLLPHLLEPESDAVLARFQFSTQGVLRLVRKDLAEESA